MPKKDHDELIRRSDEFLRTDFEKLDKESAKEIIEDLREVIRYHDWRYYVKSDPVISDGEYDKLFGLLEKIEDTWEVLKSDNSPTQRVSEELIEEFETVEHLKPMLSLESFNSREKLEDFDKRVKKNLKDKRYNYFVEPKFDGSGIALVYENDEFSRGATRGNGVRGDDVSANVKTIKNIPLKTDFSEYGISNIEIRGEVLISKRKFEKINKRRDDDSKSLFANPRNAASGTLRLQDPKEVAKRELEIMVYQITTAKDEDGKELVGTEIKTQKQSLELLDKLGFNTPLNISKKLEDIDAILGFFKEWEEKRESYSYEIDGLVIKVDELGLHEKLGITSRHPKWAAAFKFESRQATTKIEDIRFQVGRSGVITPVAKLEPVSIGGVVVSSASLINEDFIEERDIRDSDTVLVERAGDVIPYIVKPIPARRDGSEEKIKFPKRCPSCGKEIKRIKGDAPWRCFNIDCPKQKIERMIHFASKEAMDIEGLSKKKIDDFYNKGIMCSIEDIYKIDYNEVKKLEGFGEKSVENLKKAIEDSKKRNLAKFIYALGIPHIGINNARALSEKVGDIEDLEEFTIEDFKDIEDFGEVMAKSIFNFFNDKRNKETISNLKSLGVTPKKRMEKKVSSKLEGLIFVFSGALECCTREEAQQMVKRHGAKATSSISSNTDYLVIGEEPGTKVDDAKENDVSIIDESEFLDMVKE